MYFVIYKDSADYWRWTYFAANNKKIADSGEGYVNKQDCLNGIQLMKGSSNAPIYEK